MFGQTNLATFLAPYVEELVTLIEADKNEKVDQAALKMFGVSEEDVLRTCELYGAEDSGLKKAALHNIKAVETSLAQVAAMLARSKAGI